MSNIFHATLFLLLSRPYITLLALYCPFIKIECVILSPHSFKGDNFRESLKSDTMIYT